MSSTQFINTVSSLNITETLTDRYASIENLGNAGSVMTFLNDAGATDWTENYDATCNTSTEFCYGSTIEFSVVTDPAQHYALLSHSSSVFYYFTLGCVCPTETPTTYPSLYPSSTPTEAFFTDEPMDTDDDEDEDDDEDNNSLDDVEDLFPFLSILSLFLCI